MGGGGGGRTILKNVITYLLMDRLINGAKYLMIV